MLEMAGATFAVSAVGAASVQWSCVSVSLVLHGIPSVLDVCLLVIALSGLRDSVASVWLTDRLRSLLRSRVGLWQHASVVNQSPVLATANS